jgi:hypothetical protein
VTGIPRTGRARTLPLPLPLPLPLALALALALTHHTALRRTTQPHYEESGGPRA